MTMNTHVARSVRRALVVLAMVASAELLLYDWLHAQPVLPSAGADRVRVRAGDGPPHVITDRATMARILEIVRSRGGEGTHLRDGVCFFDGGTAEFYEGFVAAGHVFWRNDALIFPGREGPVYVVLGRDKAAELRLLLGAP